MEVLNFSSKRGQNEIYSDFAEREKIQGLKNLNVPNLRFPEFTEDWVQTTIGEIGNIKNGPFGSVLHAEDYVSNGVPIVTTEHFKFGTLPTISEGIPQVSDEDYIRLKGYVLNENDIVFSRVGSVDINALVGKKQSGWLFSGRVLRVRPMVKINPLCLHYVLSTESVKKDIRNRAVGQTMPSINTPILSKTALKIPNNIIEQNKIASLLSLLDNRIATQNKIIEDLKKLKVAIRDNQLNIIRKQYGLNSQISELLDYEQPSKYIVSNTEYLNDNNLIPVLTANKAFILGYTDETFGIYDKGQCIILDDFTLDCKLVDFAFKVKSSAIKILTSKNGISLRYIYEYINYIGLETAEHKRHYISEIEPMLIAYPGDNNIVNAFCDLMEIYDKKIEIENKYLQSLLSQKAYLLSNMFI